MNIFFLKMRLGSLLQKKHLWTYRSA